MIYGVDLVTCATCLFITGLLAWLLHGIMHMIITTSREKELLNKCYSTLDSDTLKVLSLSEETKKKLHLSFALLHMS
jgi:hypothetical protein